MVKKGKLRAALDAHKGRDYELEKQKKLQKKAQKAKEQRGGGVTVQEDAGKQNGEENVNWETDDENASQDGWEGLGSGDDEADGRDGREEEEEVDREQTDGGDEEDESVDGVEQVRSLQSAWENGRY